MHAYVVSHNREMYFLIARSSSYLTAGCDGVVEAALGGFCDGLQRLDRAFVLSRRWLYTFLLIALPSFLLFVTVSWMELQAR